MRPALIVIAVLFFSASLCAQQTPPQKGVVIPPVKLKSKEDSLQYSLGSYMGNFLIKGGFSTLNLEIFLAGLNDVYRNKPRMINDSIAYNMLSTFQDETALKRNKFLEEQLFEVLKSRPGVGKLPSGVQFLVIKPGKGPKPQDTDTIVINYKGTLANGEVFENTFLASPITTTVTNLVNGLNEIIQLMPVGATYQVFIPAALAYGVKGLGNKIPPNSALMVTVELVAIKNR
jgi:FKBP-type peptidyl-prolyl cis-trans isomerase FklB